MNEFKSEKYSINFCQTLSNNLMMLQTNFHYKCRIDGKNLSIFYPKFKFLHQIKVTIFHIIFSDRLYNIKIYSLSYSVLRNMLNEHIFIV